MARLLRIWNQGWPRGAAQRARASSGRNFSRGCRCHKGRHASRLRRHSKTMFSRISAFVYGVVCYLAFFATFLYAIGFIGNFGVPKSIDSGPHRPFIYALAVNAALLGLFAVQHSLMARQWFKRAWTRIVPAPAERSTYVLVSSLLLLLLFWQWRPMSGIIWHASHSAGRFVLSVLFATGWLIALTTTFLIDHFDLFGLRQVYLHLRRRKFTPIRFKIPDT